MTFRYDMSLVLTTRLRCESLQGDEICDVLRLREFTV